MSYHPPIPYDIQTLSESRLLARTLHTCTVCAKPIAIGSRYQRIVIRDHSKLDQKKAVSTVKWHLPICPEAVS